MSQKVSVDVKTLRAAIEKNVVIGSHEIEPEDEEIERVLSIDAEVPNLFTKYEQWDSELFRSIAANRQPFCKIVEPLYTLKSEGSILFIYIFE